MPCSRCTVVLFSTALLAAAPVQAQFGDLLKQLKIPGITTSEPGAASLTNEDMIAGLKEALAQGAEAAIAALGRTDGYFGDGRVKIPLPDELLQLDSVLRSLGQSRYSDEFVLTMNRAAEAAVPEASAIIGDAIRELTVADAKRLLNGPDDAATKYFRQVGEERLAAKMRPIVSDTTSRTGATQAYKSLLDKAGVAAYLLGGQSPDLDTYVTSKALDGLFFMVATEEKRIRENPVARSTDLLKKVFGSISP